jgi:hypothetical protein
MSRGQVKWFLAGYFLLFFGAVFARIDYFPFSWVPMYGMRDTDPLLTVPIGDLRQREQGFKVVRANGDVDYISRHDLNMPPANFRRLYYERAFGKGPPQHLRERKELHPINRWWYERFVGPDPLLNADYPRQILDRMNRTFGHRPGDPEYIVRLEARSLFARYPREDRDRGDLSKPLLEEWRSVTTLDSTTITRSPAHEG